MQCPSDGQTLAMTTREGIEIDYCPTCRGVWLDRGELDKIIERTAATTAHPPVASYSDASRADRPAAPEPRLHGGDQGYRRDDDDDDDRSRYRPSEYDTHGRRKKRSFLGDLFDFD